MLLLVDLVARILAHELEEVEQKSMAVIGKLRSGARVTDAVEGAPIFLKSFHHAQEFVSLIETLPIPSVSCYNSILAHLRVDCHVVNETQQRSFMLKFTRCFYNISGISVSFKSDDSEELQVETMAPSTYQTYIIFKQHWRNLCHFARQLVLSEEIAGSLADLLHTMVASTLAGLELREELNRTTVILNETILRIASQVDQANRNLAAFFDTVGGLQPLFHWISEFTALAEFLIQNLKLLFAAVILLSIFGIVVPKVIGRMVTVSLIVFIVDKFLDVRDPDWNESLLRSMAHLCCSGCCIAYPVYILLRHLIAIAKRLRRLRRP